MQAVLSHHCEDVTKRLVVFAARALAPVENRYSHLDKEAIAITFGVKHFHQYIYIAGSFSFILTTNR